MIAECISNGHPDKVADIIADAIVDAYLTEDQDAVCGIKTLVSRDLVVISGELTSDKKLNIEDIVRESLRKLGFDGKTEKFNGLKVPIVVKHNVENIERSEYLFEQGAADQCFVVGYACKETNTLMPAAQALSRALIDRLAASRKVLDYLRADAKSLVSLKYVDGKPRLESVLISTEHLPGFELKKLRNDVKEGVIYPILGKLIDNETNLIINPIGPFENAGPYAETGLSGRKVVVDGYGSVCAVGGGAISGKDPSKLDRSGAYYARFIAKSLVANNLAEECKVTLGYGIGISRPLSIEIEAKSDLTNAELEKIVRDNFHFTPASIINQLYLNELSYEEVTKKGHFGRIELPWEKTVIISR